MNDDGVGATGLELLTTAALTLSDDLWTVAPAGEKSGAAHSITITQPLRVHQLSDRVFSVDGTPVDCVALALAGILDRRPDIVLSGVNRGPNMADDIAYSGTCGAAREAAGRGIPAISLSLALVPGGHADWSSVRHHLPDILGRLCNEQIGGFVNVNFPAIPSAEILGTKITTVGRYPGTRFVSAAGRDPRQLPYRWLELQYPAGPFPAGTDIAAVDNHYISVTPMRVDLTDEEKLTSLAAVLELPAPLHHSRPA